LSTYEIRQVAGEEYYRAARKIADYAFAPSPQKVEWEKLIEGIEYIKEFRTFVAYDGETPLATVNLIPMTQNVRGKTMPMSGVSGVATLPEARRRGLVRATFDHAYRSMVEAGEPISTLYPFRESFYERLGYAVMNQVKRASFSPADLAASTRKDLRGTAQQLSLEDGYDEYRAYLERYQTHRHGFALQRPLGGSRMKSRNDHWVLLARNPAGETIGAAIFNITGYTERLQVWRFYYDSADARMLLLEWLARHVDHVSEIEISMPYDDSPDLWAPDLFAKVYNDKKWFTTPMGRVIDIAALSGIETGPGSVTLEITDPQIAGNSGIWTFTTGNDGTLAVERGGTPDASVTIQALSALVFIGQNPDDFRLRGWGEVPKHLQPVLRSIFPRRPIVIHEEF
jgi:predicted acetyltransferase